MTPEAVRVRDLSVSYGKIPIISSWSFSLPTGGFVSIIGKSGVGKTTLLHALAGFLEFEGTICRPDRLAMLFQAHALFPWMTVEENIAVGFKGSAKERCEKIQALLRLIGLESRSRDYPSRLSGGQQQRVALARALAMEPELLLLDEPFANLDYYTRLEIIDWLDEHLPKNRTTTILVTHDLDEALFLSDRIIVMQNPVSFREHEIRFERPRDRSIRYSTAFQSLKKDFLQEVLGPER